MIKRAVQPLSLLELFGRIACAIGWLVIAMLAAAMFAAPFLAGAAFIRWLP